MSGVGGIKKARRLREALIKAVPQLETNTEMMRIFADEGNIDARLAASLSHEKIHTLNVIVCDFVGDPDLISVPVAAGPGKNSRISASASSSPCAPSSKRKVARCT